MKKLLIPLLVLIVSMGEAQTRGAAPGEIYYSGTTYQDGQGQVHRGIFRSTDHGAHLQLQYDALSEPPEGEMRVGQVLGDATPGALYSYGSNELWASFDYGETWACKDFYTHSTLGQYLTGNNPGVVYKIFVNEGTQSIELFNSINYGNDFSLVNDSIIGYWGDVGFLSEDIHLLKIIEWPVFDLGLLNSSNLGYDFSFIEIDSNVEGYVLSGHYPEISRGASAGELYLITWHLPSNYHIYFSEDYGQSFELKYESGECNFYYWGYSFTAGCAPGSFYVFRNYMEDMGTHKELYIDYSSDYGQTFTTYHHVLDSTVSVGGIDGPAEPRAFPNPFSSAVNFSIPGHLYGENASIEIFDTEGKLVREIACGPGRATWDGRNSNGNKVADGLYLYRFASAEHISGLNKILLVKR